MRKLAISSANSALPSALAAIRSASNSGNWSTPIRACAIRAVSRAESGSIRKRVTRGCAAQGGLYSGRLVWRIRSWSGSAMSMTFVRRASEALSSH